MKGYVDTDIHQEPMGSAVVLHWLAQGHEKARFNSEGVLIPWAMLAIGLLAAERTSMKLPQKKQSFVGWMRSEGARDWRGYSRLTILAWKDTLWVATAHGQTAGILTLVDGRISAIGRVSQPSSSSPTGLLRRSARAIGGTLGSEQDDRRISSALGLEFEQ